MSALGPEFFNFIKKLEDNGDKLPAVTPLEQPVEFEFNNATCHVCNGYYGPSFGEPVCVTCHAFLFPDFPSYLPSSYFYSEKTDDGDSGNDEPSDLNFSADRRVNRACPLPGWWYYRNSLDSETSPEDEASRASNSGPGASGSGSGGSAGTGGVPREVGVKGEHTVSGGSNKEVIAGGLKGEIPAVVVAEAVAGGSQEDSHVAAGVPLGKGTAVRLFSAGSTAGAGGTVGGGAKAGEAGQEVREVGQDLREAGQGIREVGQDLPQGQGLREAGQGPPPPPHSLARSLLALSTPRPPDNLAPGLVEQLPSEVVLCILSYLDDLSLCACARVCARWWRLVRARVPPPRWAAFAARRWPLYRPLAAPAAPAATVDWHKKYQALVESCFCRNCLVQMCVQAQPAGEENAWRRNRLRIELKMMRNDPPEGIAATPLDPKCCHWQASVTGPVGSPYEGGIFYLYIQVPYSYPMSPPVVRFLTRILHPNVSRHGDVGIDSVHHNWSLALTISKVLISIQSLLTDPYTAVCMEPELGEMYVRDRVRFETLARRWTWRYAMHDILPY